VNNSGNAGVDGSGRRQTPNTCPEGHVSGVPGGEGGGGTCSTRGEGRRTCRTPKTRLCGHVCGIRHKGKGRERVEHQKHAHKGMFIVFGARGTAENVSNIKNMPLRACSWCPTREEWRERAEHDARGRERTRRTSEHVLGGHVLVFETSQRGGGHVLVGLFVVLETRGRGGDVPSTKTRHSGRVLMFEMSERGEGLVMCRLGLEALGRPKPALSSRAKPEPH